MEVSFDKEYFWNMNNASKVKNEIDNVGTMLNQSVLPLFKQNLSTGDIAKTADDSYGIFGDLWQEDHTYSEELFKSRPVLLAETVTVDAEGYFNETRDAEYPGMPALDSLDSANKKLAELQNVGDYTEPFYSKTDLYMIGRLEKVKGGEYQTWDDFLEQYKQKYAYHEASEITYVIKNVAVTAFNWLNHNVFGEVFAAANCGSNASHNYAVKIYTIDKESKNSIQAGKVKLAWASNKDNATCGDGTTPNDTKWKQGGSIGSLTNDINGITGSKGQTAENTGLNEHTSNGTYGSTADETSVSGIYSGISSTDKQTTGVAVGHNCNVYAPLIAIDEKDTVNAGITFKGTKILQDKDNKKIKFITSGSRDDAWYRKHKVGSKGTVRLQWEQIAGAANSAQEARIVFYFLTTLHEFQPVATSEALPKSSDGTAKDKVTIFDSNTDKDKPNPGQINSTNTSDWPSVTGDNVEWTHMELKYDNGTPLDPSDDVMRYIPTCWDYSTRLTIGAYGTLHTNDDRTEFSETAFTGSHAVPNTTTGEVSLQQCKFQEEVTVYSSVTACVQAYGPFASPETRAPAATGLPPDKIFWKPDSSVTPNFGSHTNPVPVAGLSKLKGTVCGMTAPSKTLPGSEGYDVYFDSNLFDEDDDDTFIVPAAEFPGSENWAPGHYYYVVNISRDGHGTVPNKVSEQMDDSTQEALILDEWYSPFAEETETLIIPFQPFATSKVKEEYIGGSTKATDTITPLAASNMGEVEKYENGLPADIDTDGTKGYWFKDTSGNFVKVTYCVTAYGKSQGPVTSPAPNAEWPAGNAGLPQVGKVCQQFGGGDSFPTAQDFEFPNSDTWVPGYYYFKTTVEDYDGAMADGGQDTGISDLIASDWTSRFNPGTHGQDEKVIRQFQPVAKSVAIGNRLKEDGTTAWDDNNIDDPQDKPTDTPNSDRLSNQYKGVVFDCKENKEQTTYTDPNMDNLPPEKMHCDKVTDIIYVGAVDPAAAGVIAADGVVRDQANDVKEDYWLKNDSGGYVPITYKVDLYGPLAKADTNGAGTNGRIPVTGLGKTTSTTPSALPTTGQPVACAIFTTNGPKWDTAQAGYKVVFEKSCIGDNHSDTELELAPGFYTTVISEIKTKQTIGGAYIHNNFFSAWGDPWESYSIPLPVYVWTQRGDSDNPNYKIGDTITDSVWVVGYNATTPKYVSGKTEHIKRNDIFYNPYTVHGWNNSGYSFTAPGVSGEDGLGIQTGIHPADDKTSPVNIYLFGPYTDTDKITDANASGYCDATNESLILQKWTLPPTDFLEPWVTKPPATIPSAGLYVFYVEYLPTPGDSRVRPFTSKCSDVNEQIRVPSGDSPEVSTEIQTNSPKEVPTVIWDKVTVKNANKAKDSTIRLSLYKGDDTNKHSSNGDPLCVVDIKVKGQASTETYNTENYYVTMTGPDAGKVKPGNGSGRCFAETPGHYYWYEEFYKPGNPDGETPPEKWHPPIPGGPGEEVDLDWPDGKIETSAQAIGILGEGIRDKARVYNVAPLDPRKYRIRIYAYGPQIADGALPICPAGAETYSFTKETSDGSTPLTGANINGEHYTETFVPGGVGNIYWVEYLDVEDGDELDGWKNIDKGECGSGNETTRVITTPPPPGTPPPPPVLVPDSGIIIRSSLSLIAITAMGIGAYDLLRHRSPFSRYSMIANRIRGRFKS
ncbi:MAG: hypothetical protein LBC95_00650 [Candidatus Nomurabacteria bacterium]|jgi:hypothetical protein|nr:hypothetical protein [Candidatus Nomurabacteria bacterium]